MLFYAYPAIVTLIELSRKRIRLTGATLQALVLSTAGAVTVVAFGGDVSISTTGIVLALAASTAYGLYLVAGKEFTRRTDAMCAACWVAAGAAGSSAVRGAATSSLEYPSGHAGFLLGEAISVGQACGGLAIVGAAAVIARSRAGGASADREVVLQPGLSPASSG
jgi:hypothetical protein